MASPDKTIVEESEHTSSEMLFGGGVEHVIATPRIEPPPKTLEEARNAPGRAAADRAADPLGSSARASSTCSSSRSRSPAG